MLTALLVAAEFTQELKRRVASLSSAQGQTTTTVTFCGCMVCPRAVTLACSFCCVHQHVIPAQHSPKEGSPTILTLDCSHGTRRRECCL
eukprot:1300788-Rhodomonas_salina.1